MYNYANIIKQSVTMRDVCARHGIEVNRANKAICPFHPDRRPSMQVYPDAGGFHCFVCGAGGDVIDFYQQYYSIGFRDALEKINDDFSLGLDLNPSQDERHKQNEAAERRRKRLLAIRSEQERLESAYNNALTNWQYWDSLKQKSAPRSFTDELSDTYVFACQHIEQAADELGRAEAALQAFRLERKNKSG